MASLKPQLTLSDLGVELDEDSEDLFEEEVLDAVSIDSEADFVAALTSFIQGEREKGNVGDPLYERRVRTGIYYCRVSVGSVKQLFRMSWVKKP